MKVDNFDRNVRIFRTVIGGKTFAAVGKEEHRTTEAIRVIFRKMLRDLYCCCEQGEPPHDHRATIGEVRENADFWLVKLDEVLTKERWAKAN